MNFMTPTEQGAMLDRCYKKVKEHTGWDDRKTILWFATGNPNLGGISPDIFSAMRPEKLEKWIDGLISLSLPNSPGKKYD